MSKHIRIIMLIFSSLFIACQNTLHIKPWKKYKLPLALTNNRYRYLGDFLRDIKDSANLHYHSSGYGDNDDEESYEEELKGAIFNEINYYRIEGSPARIHSIKLNNPNYKLSPKERFQSILHTSLTACIKEYGRYKITVEKVIGTRESMRADTIITLPAQYTRLTYTWTLDSQTAVFLTRMGLDSSNEGNVNIQLITLKRE